MDRKYLTEFGLRALREALKEQVPIPPKPKQRPADAPPYRPVVLDTETVQHYGDYLNRPLDGKFTASDGIEYPVPKIRGGYPKSAHVSIYQPPK